MGFEIFKDVPGYEGIYQVSNLANVKSLSRTMYNQGVNPFQSKEKLLKPKLVTNGKLVVRLFLDNKPKTFQIHQLVAMAFLNHTPSGLKIVVDHIDNNPLNNKLNNLQLITQRENASKDRKGGTSKYTGVSWASHAKKWRGMIKIGSNHIFLGYFTNEIDAHFAYQNKLKSISI